MASARRFSGLMWVGLIPAVFVLDLSLPSDKGFPLGVGEALGCSGGPNLAPQQWISLSPMLIRESTAAVPVATDGFFVIAAQGKDLSRELAQAQLRVVVTDEGGAEVLGDVSALPSDAGGSHLFGWVAREPLAVGARMTATLATEPPTERGPHVGGHHALEVEGAPTSPPTPEATFIRWGRLYAGAGDGEHVSCRASESSSCGTTEVLLSMPAHVVEQVAVVAAWTAPEIVGSVAWSVRVEPASPEGEASGESFSFFGGIEEYREHFDAETGGVPLFELNRVDFRDRAERYCVSVIVEDLRSGLEQRSELCSAPGALASSSSTTGLEKCYEPPSAELTPAWCELKPRSLELPVCAPYRDEPPARADAGTSSGSLAEPSANVLPARDGSSGSSFGCSLGATRSGPPGFVALAGLALTSLARRSARRRPAR